MNFELTEEQKLVQEMVRDFADNEILPKGKALEDQHEFPKEILKKIADLGILGLNFPISLHLSKLDAHSPLCL